MIFFGRIKQTNKTNEQTNNLKEECRLVLIRAVVLCRPSTNQSRWTNRAIREAAATTAEEEEEVVVEDLGRGTTAGAVATALRRPRREVVVTGPTKNSPISENSVNF